MRVLLVTIILVVGIAIGTVMSNQTRVYLNRVHTAITAIDTALAPQK